MLMTNVCGATKNAKDKFLDVYNTDRLNICIKYT